MHITQIACFGMVGLNDREQIGEKQLFKNSNCASFFTINEKAQLSRLLLDLTRANDVSVLM